MGRTEGVGQQKQQVVLVAARYSHITDGFTSETRRINILMKLRVAIRCV